jgi:hypothetical protein
MLSNSFIRDEVAPESWLKVAYYGVGNIAKWMSMYLAFMRPGLIPSAAKRKRKGKSSTF